MKVTTQRCAQIWQSPDGKRTIWEVELLGDNGSTYKLKTYSPTVAVVGWSGEVRSYLNPRGDRFVRVAPEAHVPNQPTTTSELSIRAQWAIGQAINLASVKMDKEDITLPVIRQYALELFKTVSEVKGEQLSDEERQIAKQLISGKTRPEAAP